MGLTPTQTRQGTQEHLALAVPGAVLRGDLDVPAGATGVVVFAHGSGSGRHSPRNQLVAAILREHGMGTLLVDLLTEEEERIDRHTAHLRFDIPLLAGRLRAIGDGIGTHEATSGLRLGYFGASTGAAAALIAAAERPDAVAAVVSRGGRPDLAGKALASVRAPVLLIVGGNDREVLKLNEAALAALNAASRLIVIPHATHLFEEPGTLEQAANAAASWFTACFGAVEGRRI